jgi:hypothetical protein
VYVLWVGVDVGGFEMRNEEPGRLRTDESGTEMVRDGMWGLERLAANTRYRMQR